MSENPSLDLDSTIARKDGTFAADVGPQVAILDAERARYYLLNVTARAVWQRLETPVRVGDLCHSLQGQFKVEPANCEAETVALLRELLRKKLVRVVECGE